MATIRGLLPLLLLLGTAPALFAAPEDGLLILDLRLDQRVLAAGITGSLQGGRVLLPLGEIVRALDFAIEVDPAAGTAGGWFLREDRLFSLDCERRLARVEGRPLPFESGQVAQHPDDLYVDSTVLSAWFPVRFEIDLAHLAVVLLPQEKLPFQLHLERQARGQGLRRGAAPADRQLPVTETPYRILDWPAVEGTLTWSLNPGLEGRSTSLLHEARWTGDLLGMTGDLSIRSRQGDGALFGEEPPIRLSLGRKDPDAGLLGPWRATEVALGSLFLPAHPLVRSSQPIQGALLSSFPLEEAEPAESTTLSGHAPPGWDVELYRDDMLIDLQRVGADGRFLFSEVPLFLGANLFRLVVHGPQGQRREEPRRVLIGERTARPGESRYRIAAGRLDEATRTADDPWAASLEAELGLRDGLAAALTLDSLERPGGGRQDFTGLSLRATRGGIFGRMDLVRALDGGWAARGVLQSLWRRFGFQLQRDRYEGFASPQIAGSAGLLRARTALRLHGLWGRERARPVSYSLAAEWEEQRAGTGRRRLSGSLAGGARGLSWIHLMHLDVAPAAGHRALGGSLLVNGRLRQALLRSELSFRIEPEAQLDSFALTADRILGAGRTLRLGARHTLAPDPRTAVSASAGWLSRRARLDLGLGYEQGAGRAGWTSHLTLGYSLRRNPLSGRWQMSDPARTAGGAVAARVFLDRDHDGRFGPGDDPLPGIEIRPLDGGARPVQTDARGGALLAGLPVLRPVDLELAAGSLADPAWIPVTEGARLTLRPGAVPHLDFPVVVSGEAEGTVRLREKGETRPAANVRLQLVDAAGRIVREARSESDGFYLFERIPPGRYRVRIDPEQAGRLRLKPSPERTLDIASEGDVVRGVDFDLARRDG